MIANIVKILLFTKLFSRIHSYSSYFRLFNISPSSVLPHMFQLFLSISIINEFYKKRGFDLN